MRVVVFCFMCFIAFLPGLSAQSVDLMPIQVVGSGESARQFSEGSYSRPEYFSSDISGVDIQSRAGYGFLQDVSIRGGIFEDTTVRFNGIPLNNPQTGHYHVSLPVVSSDIQDVDAEVNAQSLNFRLREPRGDEGYLRSAFGSAGFAEQVFSMTKKQGENIHRVSAEGLRTDGLRDDTDGYRTAGSYLFRRMTAEYDAMVYAAAVEKKFGANGAYAAPWYMSEQEYLKQEFFMGSLTFHGDLDVTFKPYFHRTQNTFWLDRDQPAFYRNDHTSYVSGHLFEAVDSGSGRFIALELERHDIRSTNLGIHQRFFSSAEIGLKTQYTGRWRYDGGIKAAYVDEFPLEFLPRFYLGYQLSSFWTAHMKGERLVRPPSFTELYYQSPSDAGNPRLGPQRSDNTQAGIAYQTDQTWFGFDVFFRRQNDTIDWVRNAGDTRHQAVNAGRVDARGFDASLGGKINLPFFNRINAAYTYMDLDKTTVYDISKYAFEYLRHRMVIKLDSQQAQWSYGVSSIYEYHVSLGERWLFGAEAAYQINSTTRVFVSGENLFDKTYEEFRYIQGDPLFFKAGLEMRF